MVSSALVSTSSGQENMFKQMRMIKDERKFFISALLWKHTHIISRVTRITSGPRSHREPPAPPPTGGVGRPPPCPPTITGTAQLSALREGSKAGTAQVALAVNLCLPSFGIYP